MKGSAFRRALVSLAVPAIALAMTAAGTATSGGHIGNRLIIPRLHLSEPLGTTLDTGPAFYPGSGRPGESFTIAIAGHRTTHTHPFWSLDRLARRDQIVIVWSGRRHVYQVTSSRVVAPTDWSVTREEGHERLVLTTCTPRFSARQRLVVFARAVRP